MNSQLDRIDTERLLGLARAALTAERDSDARLQAEVAFEEAATPFMTQEQQEDWTEFCFNAASSDECLSEALRILGLCLQTH